MISSHQCLGFDQISLDGSMFTKQREKKCCILIFEETFRDKLGLSWAKLSHCWAILRLRLELNQKSLPN